jgi:hypothetical protein
VIDHPRQQGGEVRYRVRRAAADSNVVAMSSLMIESVIDHAAFHRRQQVQTPMSATACRRQGRLCLKIMVERQWLGAGRVRYDISDHLSGYGKLVLSNAQRSTYARSIDTTTRP